MPTSATSAPLSSSPAGAPTEDLWRVYIPEWTIAATLTGTKPHDTVSALREQLWDLFAQHYEGRLQPQDVEVQLETDEAGPDGIMVRLMLRVPVLKGEYKYRAGALEWLDANPRLQSRAKIVQRNSKEDHELRNYSIVKLPDVANA